MRYIYDRNDRLLKEISPYGYESESDGGAGTTYAYDSRGNRTRITNALGETVQEISYNLQNLPIMQKDTFGNQTFLSYELDGQIKDVRREDRGGRRNRSHRNYSHFQVQTGQRNLQQYEYNARGQIVGIVDGNQNIVDAGKDSNISTWHYDSLGRVIRAISDGHSYEYIYDKQGNLKEKRSAGKTLISYAHDMTGHRKSDYKGYTTN